MRLWRCCATEWANIQFSLKENPLISCQRTKQPVHMRHVRNRGSHGDLHLLKFESLDDTFILCCCNCNSESVRPCMLYAFSEESRSFARGQSSLSAYVYVLVYSYILLYFKIVAVNDAGDIFLALSPSASSLSHHWTFYFFMCFSLDILLFLYDTETFCW